MSITDPISEAAMSKWTDLNRYRLARWFKQNAKKGSKDCACGARISRTKPACLACTLAAEQSAATNETTAGENA